MEEILVSNRGRRCFSLFKVLGHDALVTVLRFEVNLIGQDRVSEEVF
jgi:hypothetical protein